MFWDDAVIFGAVSLGWLLVGALFLILAYDLFFYIRSGFAAAHKKMLKKDHLMILHAFAAAGVALVLVKLINTLYNRPRPFEVVNNMHQLVFHQGGSAFPSGHASVFFAIAMGVYFYRPKWSVLFFAGAALISISRVIAGVHWPLDVLGGALVGILSAWVLEILLKKFKLR